VKTPQLRATVLVISGDIAPDRREIRAAMADQHLAPEHPWRAADIAFVVLADRHHAPRDMARLRVDRGQPPVDGADEDFAAIIGKAAYPPRRAHLGSGLLRSFQVHMPQFMPCSRIERADMAITRGEIEDAADRDRRGQGATAVGDVMRPGQPQPRYVTLVDFG
jgi:hypothetical protein